jgi:RNA recognition motif-containing protein
MTKKLHVGNLAYETTEDSLKTAFAPFGRVSEVNVVVDHGTGRSRGFASVTMASAEEAREATERMHGAMLDGHALSVNDADERAARSPTGSLPIVVYQLYGHYSFNARDGGQEVRIVLSEGYSVADWLNGAKLVIGTRVAVSIEQAIHHGFACIVA